MAMARGVQSGVRTAGPRGARGRLARRARPGVVSAKPLLGFGPAGWLLLAPLSALLVVALTGYDLRYAMQSRVNEIWGWDGLSFFTVNVLFAHAWASWFWPPLPHFGLLGLCIVLLGLQLHPRACGRARVGLIVALGMLIPIAVYTATRRRVLLGVEDINACFAFARLLTGAGVATALWLATRSSRVGVLTAASLIAPAGLDWVALLVKAGDLPASLAAQVEWLRLWSGLAMNVALAGVLWTWGLRARLCARQSHQCEACGYDLRGLASPICPECGTSDSTRGPGEA